MSFAANSPTVDDLPGLSPKDIAQLPIESLVILQREVDERIKRDKEAKARVDGALTFRYANGAAEERQAIDEDTVHREDDGRTSLTDMGPILRQRELASRWRLSDRTLEAWRRKHSGPSFFRLGGKCFYALRDIEEFERRARIDTRGLMLRSQEDRP